MIFWPCAITVMATSKRRAKSSAAQTTRGSARYPVAQSIRSPCHEAVCKATSQDGGKLSACTR